MKATDGSHLALTCREQRLASDQSPELPVSIVQIVGAPHPLRYLVYTPADGYRRVLAEYRGEPGMTFTASVGASTPWHSGITLVPFTTTWTGLLRGKGFGGITSLTLCLAKPPLEDMNVPVCAFTTPTERWVVTSYSMGSDAIPPMMIGPRQAWAVAIDHTYGAALVVQVRGERDPSVPTGAFLVAPPRW